VTSHEKFAALPKKHNHRKGIKSWTKSDIKNLMAGKHTLIDLEEKYGCRFLIKVLDFSQDHLQCNKMD